MNYDQAAMELASRVRRRFPEEASRTDLWLEERGSADLPQSGYLWIEAFAGRVTDAVRDRRSANVIELTGFFAVEYREGSAAVQHIIDVAFAENILFGIDADARRWAWPHIATAIRQLYAGIWGVPRP
ncbi:DUF7674 family protein [Lysobacter panacisoli]|nr:hypothetical protein [Lysobacter panacisoli]